MFTDSSLTNIFLVSGVSQIRYRVYTQSCKQASLADFLKGSPHAVATNGAVKASLVSTFRNLLLAHIPCHWRIAPDPAHTDANRDASNANDLTFELWVFWFDDRHTGEIDSNTDLAALEEIKVGSFTWENTVARSLSPTASPGNTASKSGAQAIATVSEEYRLFVTSVVNVIQGEMIRKGALMLGGVLIFPEKNATTWDANTISSVHAASNPLLPSIVDRSVASTLSCTYNVYLTNTHLIIQPTLRHLYLRRLTWLDLQAPGKQVLISPSGRHAAMGQNTQPISPQLTNHILRQWSQLLHIPYHCLAELGQCNADGRSPIPLLVFLKTDQDGLVLYPSALVYVRTSHARASSSVGGMSGTMRYEQGYLGDLGEKWSQWAWTESVNRWMEKATVQGPTDTTDTINYWQYDSPNIKGITAILESISATDIASSQGVLQKALNEPVGSSPIMAAKTVATPASSGAKVDITSGESDYLTASPQQHQSELSLAEFAFLHFADHETKKQADFQSFSYSEGSHVEPMGGVSDAQMTPLLPVTPSGAYTDQIMDPTPSAASVSRDIAGDMAITSTTMYQSPHMSISGNDFDFGLSMESIDVTNNMDYGMQNRWDKEANDLDNLNFDVTEEDFDFFESAKVEPQDHGFTSAPPAETPRVDPSLMLFDLVTLDGMDTGEHNLPIASKQEPNDFNPLLPNQGDLLSMSPLMRQQAPEHQSTTKPNHSPIPDMVAFRGAAPQDASTADTALSQTPAHMSPSISPSLFRPQVAVDTAKHDGIVFPLIVDIQAYDSDVPSEFAPVKIVSAVNDAKYNDGGKFMYLPVSNTSAATDPVTPSENKLKRSVYHPDFVPGTKRRALSGPNEYAPVSTAVTNPPSETSALEATKTVDRPGSNRKDAATGNKPSSVTGSDSDRDTDTDSESDSDSDSDSDSSDSDSDAHTEQAFTPDQWTVKLDHMPLSFALHFLPIDQECEAHTESVEESAVEDSAVDLAVESKEEELADEDLQALDYLCQQVVLGGYPFADGIASVSGNGGELSEGVSTNVFVSRRRNLIHSFGDNVHHVPALPSEHDNVALELKASLSDLFCRNKVVVSDGMDINLHASMPGSVSIKGPLSIQQYYELTETNQAHSKYGKYQVKKRRPAEPNLDTLCPPSIVVSRQEDHLEASPKLVTFWEKMRIEPYSPRKNISYFIVYPSNDAIESACVQFSKSLSTVYETCLLGVHHPGNIGPYRRGLVPVPLLPETPGKSWQERQLRSYMAECQNLGSALGSAVAERMHIVIYLVNPGTDPVSYLNMSRCFHKLMIAYHAASMGSSTKSMESHRARLVLQLLPMEHVLRSNAFGGYTKFGLKEVAFSVYNKCHIVVTRNHSQVGAEDSCPVAEIYAPQFILAKPIPDSIQYSLSNPLSPFPTILAKNESLHLAYSTSLDRRWMTVVWTDNQGELLEFAVLHVRGKSTRAVFEEAWWRTKKVARRTGFSWNYVIAKIGLMFEEELQAWLNTVPNDERVTVVCADMESTLCVQNDIDQPETGTMESSQTTSLATNMPADTFSTSSAASIPAATSNAAWSSDVLEAGSLTQALLLNHRVAYSSQRNQVAEGALATSSNHRWMLPLASGYLIQTDTYTKEPSAVHPVVIEIHLLHNQMQHSAYSTLRDIIKRYHALSYMNMPSGNNCIPFHFVLAERLSQILQTIHF